MTDLDTYKLQLAISAKLTLALSVSQRELKHKATKMGYMVHEGANTLHEWAVVYNDYETYFVSRGTDELADWKTNLMFKKVSTPFGKIHEGFYEAAMEIYAKLPRVVYNSMVVFTGHSKGAAIATILAAILHDYCKVVITFGSPKVGGYGWYYHFDQDHLRVRNGRDAVTYTPFINYWHTGKLLKVGTNNYHSMLHYYLAVEDYVK